MPSDSSVRLAVCVALLAVVLPGLSVAGTVTESFESTLPSTWTWHGSGGYATSTSGVSPTDGSRFAYVTTAGSSYTDVIIKPGNGQQSSTTGSALYTEVAFDGQTILSFDVMFLTQEDYTTAGHERDMSIVALLGPGALLQAPTVTLFSARVRQQQGNDTVVPGQGLTLTTGV